MPSWRGTLLKDRDNFTLLYVEKHGELVCPIGNTEFASIPDDKRRSVRVTRRDETIS